MSAALLHNNEKPHELVDDRESSLHVLTWTALRFTKHTISGGGSSRFLRAFDEEYKDEDGVKGGDLKKGFLLGQDIIYHGCSRSTAVPSWTGLLKSSPKPSLFGQTSWQ